jgi:Fe-S-cluster containining protein
VPVDRATADRLRAHDWGGDPFEANADPQHPFRIRLVEGGRCFFLDDENRCRIHREISYEAKPAVCRAFPLAVLEVDGKQYGRLSFWCPTVVENAGKPLEHQLRWIKETARHVDRRSSPLKADDGIELAVRDVERIHHAVRKLLSTTSLTIEDRLAAASAVIGRLAASANGGAVERVIARAESDGAAALAAEARRRGRPAAGRRVLSLYLLHDAQGGRFSRLGRFFSLLLFGIGLAPIASKAVQAKASWRQVRRVAFDRSDAGNELLTRYFCSKVDSRRYVAGEATLVTGFNLLVAAYGIINLLARMRAAAAGRASCDDDDIRAAVRAADLLVVEHRGQDRAGVQALLSQAALGSPGLCGDVLARLER